jgi:hypothetical protein
MATETSSPVACVWWSTTRGAWGCQIGNDRSWHYNEHDAIRCGQQLAERVRRCSAIAGEWT